MKRREARQGAHATEWTESTADFLRQMGYREYARYLSFHFPFTHERSLLEHVRAAPWRYDQSLFKVRAAPAARCSERFQVSAWRFTPKRVRLCVQEGRPGFSLWCRQRHICSDPSLRPVSTSTRHLLRSFGSEQLLQAWKAASGPKCVNS